MSTDRLVYASFDRVPAPKGAAVHIEAFARGLADAFGPLDLVTVAPPDGDAAARVEGIGIRHHPLPAPGVDLIERVLCFRSHLAAWWRGRHATVAHVRSIFEGYPIARRKAEHCEKLVFEVNGLPSIELKYHYPAVADDAELLRKLIAQEQTCLEAADLVVTVSAVTADYLAGRGVARDRIRVIPNGVAPDGFPYQPPRPWGDRPVSLLYAGTMAPWQGVRLALEALALCRRDMPAVLTLAGPARPRQERDLRAYAEGLGVAEAVRWLGPIGREALARLHHESDAVLAPLMPDDRNLVQGCCPLKVLEAMASGTPLIASDLPVVRELARPEVDALLVRPGSTKAIKDAILRLRDEPGLGPRLSATARAAVARGRTWDDARAALVDAYHDVLGIRRASSRRSASTSTSG